MNRALFGLALSAAFAFALPARAGDDAAHAQAGTDGLDKVIAANNGGDPNFCQAEFPTKSAIGQPCPFKVDRAWGDAVRGPDLWACWEPGDPEGLGNYRKIPPKFNQMNWDIGGSQLFVSELACNWTHFSANGQISWGSRQINAAWAQEVTEEWTDVMVEHIQSTQRYRYQEFCDADTFQMFSQRALNSVHFPHDAACKHHDNGNNFCAPGTSFGGWGKMCADWIKKKTNDFLYGAWVADSVCHKPATVCLPDPVLRADIKLRTAPALIDLAEERVFGGVLFRRKRFEPTFNVKMHQPCVTGGGAVACAGYERTIRHHAELNWTGRDYVGAETDPLYGECGIDNVSSSGGTYPTTGTNLVNTMFSKHVQTWKDTCTPPLTPCDETACWDWCERSTHMTWDQSFTKQPFGACTSEPKDSTTCKANKCSCAISQKNLNYDDVCGRAGDPACPKKTLLPACAAGLSVNPATGRCEACGKSGQVCCAKDACTEGTCNTAAGTCTKTCGAACAKQFCSSSSLQRNAWCPETCMCVPACLCDQPDPMSNGCLSWSDQWALTGCKGPNPVQCF